MNGYDFRHEFQYEDSYEDPYFYGSWDPDMDTGSDTHMSKIMQNLVVLMEPSQGRNYDHHMKAGNMISNRFCIDEDAAFEFSGVNYLKETTLEMMLESHEFRDERKVKGMDYSFLLSESVVLYIKKRFLRMILPKRTF